MFHVEQPWQKAAVYAGLSVSDSQVVQMDRFETWLGTEGIRAGGIGPNEGERIGTRHLADSVLFASVLEKPETVWDLGTGIGLPGVPLAILMPQTQFQLIDRSGRRIDLVRRLVRMLALENCQVVQGEIHKLEGRADAIVSRASLPPEQLTSVVETHLRPGGIAVVGGSWTRRPVHEGWITKEIPSTVLDRTVWLLMMRRS